MANKRMGQVTVTGEWARHLRPILRRAFWKGERSAVKAAVRAELHGNADAARSPDASESSPLRTYRGSCHCGAVQFEIATDAPELTTCDCSICRRKNALMVKVHESRFRLIAGEASLREYRFHTGTARHYFCKVCGIYPFHRKRVTPDFLGINVFCLEDFDRSGIPVRETHGSSMA